MYIEQQHIMQALTLVLTVIKTSESITTSIPSCDYWRTATESHFRWQTRPLGEEMEGSVVVDDVFDILGQQ
uniref:Uncharacterized protein n=1 Tax=Arundo donax TaxID=35708 RepID=A0A0A9A611_ARUDO